MIKRVLFIDSDASALARIKNAVELAGSYQADVFVTGQAALEHAVENPPDVAVIALDIPDVSPAELGARLRAARPGLPIILRMPAQSSSAIPDALKSSPIIQGSYTARGLLPLIEDALKSPPPHVSFSPTPPRPSLPAASRAGQPGRPSATDSPDDDMSAFDEILAAIPKASSDSDSFDVLVRSLSAGQDAPPEQERGAKPTGWAPHDTEPPATPETIPEAPVDEVPVLFEQLAAEEPPLPDLDDNGTVSDLIAVTDFNAHREENPVADIPDDMISTPDELPLDEREQQFVQKLGVSQPEASPSLPLAQVRAPVTRPSSWTTAESPTPLTEETPAASAPSTVPLESASTALHTVQHTLESAAQASVLIREGGVMASAGTLPENQIAQLAALIDPAPVLAEGTTRIKFVSLPEGSLNYMVVATPTVDAMVLLLIFPENMHLSMIRTQTRATVDALLDALREPEPAAEVEQLPAAVIPPAAEAPPEASAAPDTAEPLTDVPAETPAQPAVEAAPALLPGPPAAELSPDVDVSSLETYACAWILRDPAAEMDELLTASMRQWLLDLAAASGWTAESIDIQPDYVSLVLGVPADQVPSDALQTLKAETARYACAARPDLGLAEWLWADAYFAVAPGRPLSSEDISRFISFQRQA